MAAYYNENDPYCAQWLRNLISAGHIAPGEVDERSIADVKPADLAGYTQCHFFAGIGVWSHALRSAGWRDDRPVWTGSCPCQPFSAAGKGGGEADERHLWPAFFHLIQHAKPRDVVVFGEQVASKRGLAWLDLVHADLEGQGYAVGAIDLCAAGVGAPHIRQRSFFVADADARSERLESGSSGRIRARRTEHDAQSGLGWGSENGELAVTESQQHDRSGNEGRGRGEPANGCSRGVALGDTSREGLPQQRCDGRVSRGQVEPPEGQGTERAGSPVDENQGTAWVSDRKTRAQPGFWSTCDWLPCIDGKARPVEPGTFPLAHGATARVGRLRAYGNAIVPQLAAEFIRAYMSL